MLSFFTKSCGSPVLSHLTGQVLHNRNRFQGGFRIAREAYLLRAERQKATFLTRFSPVVRTPPAGKEEIVIGILYLLYLDGRIDMSFSQDLRFFRREAASVEAHEARADEKYAKR